MFFVIDLGHGIDRRVKSSIVFFKASFLDGIQSSSTIVRIVPQKIAGAPLRRPYHACYVFAQLMHGVAEVCTGSWPRLP